MNAPASFTQETIYLPIEGMTCASCVGRVERALKAVPGVLETLLARHVFGAVLGFAGAALIVTDGASVLFRIEYSVEYAIALMAALTWSGYSTLSRLFAGVHSEIVTGYCLLTALLAAGAPLVLTTTTLPESNVEWIALPVLGVGPVGLAFFAWDIATKQGHIRTVAALSYAAPMLSTLFLYMMGLVEPSMTIPLACMVIVLGAALCSWERRPVLRNSANASALNGMPEGQVAVIAQGTAHPGTCPSQGSFL